MWLGVVPNRWSCNYLDERVGECGHDRTRLTSNYCMPKRQTHPGRASPLKRAGLKLSQSAALDDLRRFLLDRVSSYEELDVLLLLVRGSGESWSAKAVAEALGAEADVCRAALESLLACGLLATGKDSTTFRYSSMTEEAARNVETLARAYREQRAVVAMMMSANAVERVRTSAIRTFAEAFRLRGPKK